MYRLQSRVERCHRDLLFIIEVDLTELFLLRVFWAFWIHSWMFFIRFGKFSVIIPSNTLSHAVFSFCISIMHMLVRLVLLPRSLMLCFLYLLTWLRQVVVASRGLSPCGTQALQLCCTDSRVHGHGCLTACGISVSLTRDWTRVPSIARQILNHWTTREVPVLFFLILFFLSNWVISVKLFWNLLILFPPQICG